MIKKRIQLLNNFAPATPHKRCHLKWRMARPDLRDFIEWDVGNWSVALDCWLRHTTQNISTCSALELGSRNGGLSLWMASQGARVLSSDVELPTQASQLHKARGVSHLIQYESIDATSIPYTMQFDVILFKSMLGAI